jgi:hypothetical protein
MRALNAILATAVAVALFYLGYICSESVTLWPLVSWGRVGMAALGVVAWIAGFIAAMYAGAIAGGEA